MNFNEVTLMNWTHAAGGVTEYDFELVGKIDALVERANKEKR